MVTTYGLLCSIYSKEYLPLSTLSSLALKQTNCLQVYAKLKSLGVRLLFSFQTFYHKYRLNQVSY